MAIPIIPLIFLYFGIQVSIPPTRCLNGWTTAFYPEPVTAESYSQFCEIYEYILGVSQPTPTPEDIPEPSHGRVFPEMVHSVYVAKGV